MATMTVSTNSADVLQHSLDGLVENLKEYLGSKSGINSSETEVSKLKAFLTNYHSAGEADWSAYGRADPSRNYTRLLVDKINGKCNLLFIVWNPSKRSPIHDHANAHCVMKIIKGSLQETVYHTPEPTGPIANSFTHSNGNSVEEAPMQVKKQTTYGEDEVAYISDQIGLHYISNPDPNDVAVSLHCMLPCCSTMCDLRCGMLRMV